MKQRAPTIQPQLSRTSEPKTVLRDCLRSLIKQLEQFGNEKTPDQPSGIIVIIPSPSPSRMMDKEEVELRQQLKKTIIRINHETPFTVYVKMVSKENFNFVNYYID